MKTDHESGTSSYLLGSYQLPPIQLSVAYVTDFG